LKLFRGIDGTKTITKPTSVSRGPFGAAIQEKTFKYSWKKVHTRC